MKTWDTSIKFLVYIEPNIMEILNFQLHFRFCGSHLEFWKLLKGESSTPTWISFQGPHRLIISREKNYIKHFQVTPHCCWTMSTFLPNSTPNTFSGPIINSILPNFPMFSSFTTISFVLFILSFDPEIFSKSCMIFKHGAIYVEFFKKMFVSSTYWHNFISVQLLHLWYLFLLYPYYFWSYMTEAQPEL